MNYTLQFGQVIKDTPYLLAGAIESMELALISFWIGCLIGLLCNTAHIYGPKWGRLLVTGYVSLITNSPALIVLFLLFNALPEFGILLTPFEAAAIGLTLVAGAYLTEIQRAAFISVRQSETEAAEVLGFSRLQVIWYVVIPHMVRTLYAPLSNFFILMILGSSISALIGVEDLMGRAINLSSSSMRSIEVFMLVAGIYFTMTVLASYLLVAVGRRIFRVQVGVFT